MAAHPLQPVSYEHAIRLNFIRWLASPPYEIHLLGRFSLPGEIHDLDSSGCMNPSRPTSQTSRWRFTVLVVVAFSAILIPFVVFGAAMDTAVPKWFSADLAPGTLAVLGIILLAVDVILPIPSSIVCLTLCWTLGPDWGGLCAFVGHIAAFVVGYALGRALPHERLRDYVGAPMWQSFQGRMTRRAWLWIGISRPLPVLAELTAVASGTFRVPLREALPAAVLSSAGVAASYAWVVAWGRQEGDLALALAAGLGLSALYFWFSTFVRSRRRRVATSEGGLS